MSTINQVVLICGIYDEQDLPDAYGPFDDEASADKYLRERHGVDGWTDDPAQGECFGATPVTGHAIVKLFK